jgi:hypothetical protein
MPPKSANPSVKPLFPSQLAREKRAAERRAALAADAKLREGARRLSVLVGDNLRAAEAVERVAVATRKRAAAVLRELERAELRRRRAVLAARTADRHRQHEEKARRAAEREASHVRAVETAIRMRFQAGSAAPSTSQV